MVPLQKLEQIHQRYEFLEAQMSTGISGEEIAKLHQVELKKRSQTGITTWYDFAFSIGVLHHTPDPQRGVLEANRVLKQGGEFSISVYSENSSGAAHTGAHTCQKQSDRSLLI